MHDETNNLNLCQRTNSDDACNKSSALMVEIRN